MFKAAGNATGKGGTTKAIGDAAEARALAHLQAQGLTLVQRNYRWPGAARTQRRGST